MFGGNRIAMRLLMSGMMCRRIASINDRMIESADRLFRWLQGCRPDGHPGLSGLGL